MRIFVMFRLWLTGWAVPGFSRAALRILLWPPSRARFDRAVGGAA